MTNTLTYRIKLTLILSPAIFIMAAWVFFMSPQATTENALKTLSLAAVLAFAAAYSITLFVSYLLGIKSDVPK